MRSGLIDRSQMGAYKKIIDDTKQKLKGLEAQLSGKPMETKAAPKKTEKPRKTAKVEVPGFDRPVTLGPKVQETLAKAAAGEAVDSSEWSQLQSKGLMGAGKELNKAGLHVVKELGLGSN